MDPRVKPEDDGSGEAGFVIKLKAARAAFFFASQAGVDAGGFLALIE